MDNATNDLNTSAVNPRRPENSYNLANEWSRSALDVTHKVGLTWLYDLPKYKFDSRILRGAANGWQWSGFVPLPEWAAGHYSVRNRLQRNLDAAATAPFLTRPE